MATVAQIQANRLNAQKSTGPRTPAGKERASRNALKHGLLAREAVIAGEDPEEFELYREEMLEELAPPGPVEAMLAESAHGGSGSPGPPKADDARNGSPPWRTAFIRLRSAFGGDEGEPIRHGSALGPPSAETPGWKSGSSSRGASGIGALPAWSTRAPPWAGWSWRTSAGRPPQADWTRRRRADV